MNVVKLSAQRQFIDELCRWFDRLKQLIKSAIQSVGIKIEIRGQGA